MARTPEGAGAAKTNEDNWRRCRKCRGLFWRGHFTPICPKGGHHSAKGSKNYILIFGDDVQPGEESGWLLCSHCAGLFWGGDGNYGVCPTGGTHVSAINYDYFLKVNQLPEGREEGGWHYCPKCHGLFSPKARHAASVRPAGRTRFIPILITP